MDRIGAETVRETVSKTTNIPASSVILNPASSTVVTTPTSTNEPLQAGFSLPTPMIMIGMALAVVVLLFLSKKKGGK